jgi:hypothetical protein
MPAVMTVVRTSTMGEAGDIDAPIGSREWAIAIRGKILLEWNNKESITIHLMRLRATFTKHQAWQTLSDRRGRPFRSWEAFCRSPKPYGLGLPPDAFDAEVERRSLAQRGANQHTTQVASRNTGSTGASDDRAYVLARLQRDGHADLIAKVYAGELSAHAAAVLVGYRKQKTPLEQLQHWWAKTSPDERLAFLRWARTDQ